jgi:hypothetical protein
MDSYRQAIETEADVKVFSRRTDIDNEELTLATFVFMFQKDECKDKPVRTVDPYSDTHPNVSVEFKQCSTK